MEENDKVDTVSESVDDYKEENNSSVTRKKGIIISNIKQLPRNRYDGVECTPVCLFGGKDYIESYNLRREKPYKKLPSKVLKYIKEEIKKLKQSNFKKGVLFCNSIYERASYSFIKQVAVELSNVNDMLIFPVIPNKMGIIRLKTMHFNGKINVNFMRKSSENMYFFENYIDKRINFLNILSYPLYVYSGILDGEEVICFLKDKISIDLLNKEFYFEGMEIEKSVNRYVGNIEIPSSSNNYFLTHLKAREYDFTGIEDVIKRVNSIQDLSFLWDFRADEPVYSDDEVFLILANIMYMKYSVPAFNLILCGKPSSKKTPWLSICSRIFGDNLIESSQARAKGLVPSFYGDIPSVGVLIGSNYVTLLDDYFRMFARDSERSGIYVSIHNGLDNIRGLLDREFREIPSGKGSVFSVYKSSFFATDNFSYPHVLKDIWNRDPAILKRYTFCILCSESERKGNNLYVIGQNEAEKLLHERFTKIFGIDGFKAIRGLFFFMRMNLDNVKYDQDRVSNIVINMKKEKGDYFFEPKAKALIESIVMFNSLFKRHSLDLIASEEDYVDFERLLKRLIEDFEKIIFHRVNIDAKFEEIIYEKTKDEDLKKFEGDRVEF